MKSFLFNWSRTTHSSRFAYRVVGLQLFSGFENQIQLKHGYELTYSFTRPVNGTARFELRYPQCEVNRMAARHQAHDEEAWRNAKKICQLNAQQVEMARALGMNPKKLPRLRPSPQQRWKLPVGEFIEACYRKQFGGDPLDHQQHRAGPESRKLRIPQRHVDTRKRVTDAASQLGDLICYLMNLADDLQASLAQGTVAPEALPQVIAELREIAEALETGAPIFPIPAIPPAPHPPRHSLSSQVDWETTPDDEIPF